MTSWNSCWGARSRSERSCRELEDKTRSEFKPSTESPSLLTPGPTTQTQNRENERFALEVSVNFSWAENAQPRRALGVTRDVSVRGVRITAPSCPALYSRVRFQIHVPRSDASRQLQICGVGEVCRVGTDGDSFEFVVRCSRDLRLSRIPSPTSTSRIPAQP